MYLQIKNMTKTMNKNKLFYDVDFNMSNGEIITIVGNSGCGKSTFLKILAGIVHDYSGSFVLDGVEMDKVLVGQRPISLMFQDPLLFPHLNVIDNIAFPLKCKGFPKKDRYKLARDVLNSLKLEEFEKRYIYELSGGEKQRIALARAIIIKPKLLLLDEPFSKLDLTLGREIMSFMKNVIKNYNITTIFVTHNYEEAKLMSKRIFVFNNGNIKEDTNILADEFFGDGIYIDNEFIPISNLILNKEKGIPVTIVSQINIHGVDFVLFEKKGEPEKFIKSPSKNMEGKWFIDRKEFKND